MEEIIIMLRASRRQLLTFDSLIHQGLNLVFLFLEIFMGYVLQNAHG